jgi:hypothetical protein
VAEVAGRVMMRRCGPDIMPVLPSPAEIRPVWIVVEYAVSSSAPGEMCSTISLYTHAKLLERWNDGPSISTYRVAWVVPRTVHESAVELAPSSANSEQGLVG